MIEEVIWKHEEDQKQFYKNFKDLLEEKFRETHTHIDIDWVLIEG